jgi:predicted nucleic acid-binding protein
VTALLDSNIIIYAAQPDHSDLRRLIAEAVRLRQLRKMTLGDALIAATALAYDLELLTHNLDDFTWVPGLEVRDPLASP